MRTEILRSEIQPVFVPGYRVLEIAGWAGTGTTSTGKMLAEQHGAKFVCVGDIFKHITRERNIPRTESLDGKMNTLGRLMIKNAFLPEKPRSPIIIDSRLGAIFACQKKIEDPEIVIPRIKLISTHEKSAQRIAQRDSLSIVEARVKTEERNKKDAEIFKQLLDMDPDTPNEVLDDNIFDLIINTTNTTLKQNVEIINRWLLKRSLLNYI
jgi:cytidylate kinase